MLALESRAGRLKSAEALGGSGWRARWPGRMLPREQKQILQKSTTPQSCNKNPCHSLSAFNIPGLFQTLLHLILTALWNMCSSPHFTEDEPGTLKAEGARGLPKTTGSPCGLLLNVFINAAPIRAPGDHAGAVPVKLSSDRHRQLQASGVALLELTA